MIDLSVPTNYFAKRAKDLLSLVRAADADACKRVRHVYRDAIPKSDRELSQDFGLMRAQHVVAVEHSFESWNALAVSSGIEARLALTMTRVPDLNDFGIGTPGGPKARSQDEKNALDTENRALLRGSVAAVASTVAWLQENVEPTKNVNKRHTSYGIKHMAEKDIGYITNGVFIAAGIIAGYPYEIIPGSPNVPFGMSENSLSEVSLRRSSPERVLKRFLPHAIEVLAKRGIVAHPVGRAGVDLAWLDDGDVRTLRIGAVETEPFIVRLFVDHYTLFVSQKVAKVLGMSAPYRRSSAQAAPVRPKGEISLVMDEVVPALEWALAYDARTDLPQPTPSFELSAAMPDPWSYVWSKRAWAREVERAKRARHLSAAE